VYQKSHCSSPGRYFKIDEMTPDDLKEVLEIEQISFPTPWSENIFLSELHSELSRIFLAKSGLLEEQKILGYICIWLVKGEVHILNLACHPDFKRHGIATSLLVHSLFFSFQKGVRKVFLEVRASNKEALSLYRKYGFKPIGIRKRYYSDTKEDAVVMVLEMESRSFLKELFYKSKMTGRE
jgi:ribosomal-protein-alanine N-acetyltransferase